ncbi:hypothetical protein SAMN04488125_10492 [Methylorubrum salsuginis]|uniref:Uncharacterized protein n=1 Tax=Methylorubrum salsuginis TaxID=414703 RepID=A0A1I4C814_9HYPH|nr:hypothetical protein SAMN04488125_10492 [Methylorubrum salsuginis]
MSLWRIGWTGLLGALAGMVLFPRPAQGARRAERGVDPASEPACAAPDRRRR